MDGTQSSCQHVRRAPSDDFGRFTVSGGIIHFRREAGASRVAIDGWAHNNHRRQSGDQGPSLFPAGADQPTVPPSRASTGIAELESRLCRAGGFGRSEHQALAVVGVVLVRIAITEHPLPLLQDSPSITAASTVGAEWDHSASPSHPAQEKI